MIINAFNPNKTTRYPQCVFEVIMLILASLIDVMFVHDLQVVIVFQNRNTK